VYNECDLSTLYKFDNIIDPHADALAAKLGGRSKVGFDATREFDVISSTVIGQTKPSSITMGKAFRNQAKATFEATKERGMEVYYHFEGGPPSSDVLRALERYSERYQVKLTIDTDPL